VKPTVGFVAVLLRTDPFAFFRIVDYDKFRPVLEMAKTANLLTT
jgi:hypothetical protein